VSPASVRAAAEVAAGAGCDLVDGSISGPPWTAGTTRLYLSGPFADEVAGVTPELFDAMAEVFAALSTSELARSAPEEIPPDATLDDVLAGQDDARRTNVGS
jgi:hypothetical protein